MPDHHRLFDYDKKHVSIQDRLQLAGVKRPPKRSCNSCYGRGYVIVLRGNRRVMHSCGCVRKNPLERGWTEKETHEAIKLLRKLAGTSEA